MLAAKLDRHEIGVLIGILHTKGIYYLLGEGVPLRAEDEDIEATALIQRLAACNYPFNFRDGWQNQIDHLLAQEEAY